MAQVGETVKFPCETNLQEDVHWKRKGGGYIYAWRRMAPGLAPRITVDKNSLYTLTILNVTLNDSMVYGCFEDGGQGSKRFYGLTVTGFTEVSLPAFYLIFACDENIAFYTYRETSATLRY